MIAFPLALARIDEAAAPAAWLIPGAESGIWLDEISRWQAPMENLRLYVVPRSLRDARPLGALVIGIEAISPGRVRRALPYRLLAERLYLPADAKLDPPVGDAELRSLLIWEVQVLHPSAGLIGCRHDEGLGISDLLLSPIRQEVDWDRVARPTAYAPRLLAVETETPPTLEIILEQGRDGIASQSLDSLPPGEEESKLDQLMARAKRPGLQAIQWVAGNAGGEWMKKLSQWAKHQLHAIDQSLEEARFRELQRLQNLLRSNPDEALKFAIPLRDIGSRGMAPPSARLGERTPTFDLGHLAGGTPGDTWSIPSSIHSNLLAQYRAAANRELGLRRFARAAYVFAELLGDFSSAANALEQGRYFREAAILYRDRLKNPILAARCLKQGGLLLEAATIYEEIGQFEEAGDLLAALDRQEDAARCYRQAVLTAISRQSHVEAARMLEVKLHEPDEALSLLYSQWPASNGAAACICSYFGLLKRLHRHDVTLAQVAVLRDGHVPDERAPSLADLFAGLATGHPDQRVRSQAADATRVVVGRRLAVSGGADAKALVASVTRLCPEDRLLLRDATRYLGTPIKTYKLAPTSNRPKLVNEFWLPTAVAWQRAVAAGAGFFAAGLDAQRRTVVLRATWNGKWQQRNWTAAVNPAWCVLESAPSARSLLLIPLGPQRQNRISDVFPPADGFSESCWAGIPPWLPKETILGAGQDENGVMWISHRDDDPYAVLSGFSCETGQLLASRGPLELVSVLKDRFDSGETPVVARRGQIFLLTGNTLVVISSGSPDECKWRDTPLRGKRAVASPAHMAGRLAVAFDEGGVVLWDDGSQNPFAQGMQDPKIGFNRAGELFVAAGNEMRVYQTAGSKISRPAIYCLDARNVIAVCPTPRLHEIALIGSDGHVRVFALSTVV